MTLQECVRFHNLPSRFARFHDVSETQGLGEGGGDGLCVFKLCGLSQSEAVALTARMAKGQLADRPLGFDEAGSMQRDEPAKKNPIKRFNNAIKRASFSGRPISIASC